MSSVTVSEVFKAYQVARGEREKGKSPLYGQALVAQARLMEALDGCTAEIELDTDTINVLVPFLAAQQMRGSQAEIASRP